MPKCLVAALPPTKKREKIRRSFSSKSAIPCSGVETYDWHSHKSWFSFTSFAMHRWSAKRQSRWEGGKGGGVIRLGIFWRPHAALKRDPMLVEAWSETKGREILKYGTHLTPNAGENQAQFEWRPLYFLVFTFILRKPRPNFWGLYLKYKG